MSLGSRDPLWSGSQARSPGGSFESVQSITVSAPVLEHSAAGARRLGDRDRALAARRDTSAGKFRQAWNYSARPTSRSATGSRLRPSHWEAEWVEVRQLVVSATAPGGRPSRRDAVRTAQRNKD